MYNSGWNPNDRLSTGAPSSNELSDNEKIRKFNLEWGEKRNDSVLVLMNNARNEWNILSSTLNANIRKGSIDKERSIQSIQEFVAKYDNFREIRDLIKAFNEVIPIYQRSNNEDFRRGADVVKKVLDMFTQNLKLLMNSIIESQEYLKTVKENLRIKK